MLSKCEFALGIASPSKAMGRGGHAAGPRQPLFRALLRPVGRGRRGPCCWGPGMLRSVLCMACAQRRADSGAWSLLEPGWAPAARPWVKSSNLHLKRGETIKQLGHLQSS